VAHRGGFRDLRDWIEHLRSAGELLDVHAEVDADLEITEIVNRTVRVGGPALLFHHVRGSTLPVLVNQFGTEGRMCMALGVETLDAAGEALAALMSVRQPFGTEARLRAAARLRRLSDLLPQPFDGRPPCQERVLPPDLDQLPIQKCWPLDAAPFITLPMVITSNPRTGVRNVGVYRMQKIDRTSTFMHWQLHKDGAEDWRNAPDDIEVVVALGCDPITTYAATLPLPKDVDEFEVAGLLRGSPVELARATSVDLEVPAHAEIVLEGRVSRTADRLEGPFGDHMGYYSLPESFPVFTLSAMTMRNDAIYPSIQVGPPPQEDAWLGKASERLLLPALRLALPELVDYDLPIAGAFQHCALVSVRKTYPGHARKVMHALWGSGLLSLLKSIVIVDANVNVHRYDDVFFHLCANVDPARDIMIVTGALDQLDHSAQWPCYGGKIGIDATVKLESEGARDWPPFITMEDSVVDLVTSRWAEYGFAAIEPSDQGDRRPLF
jgi:4-hydroxy-3-polyprenylbenzoate decarboxylase